MPTLELEEEKQTGEERSPGAAVATSTGIAYTRKGDSVREESLGATDPDAALYDDATKAARAKAVSDMQKLEQGVAEVAKFAKERGVTITLPSVDPNSASGKDLELLQAEIVRIERQVQDLQMEKMLEEGGQLAGMLAGLSMLGGGAAGLLASLGIEKSGQEMGISGGENVSRAALGTPEITTGIGALGLRQQRGGPDLPA